MLGRVLIAKYLKLNSNYIEYLRKMDEKEKRGKLNVNFSRNAGVQ